MQIPENWNGCQQLAVGLESFFTLKIKEIPKNIVTTEMIIFPGGKGIANIIPYLI